MDNNINKVIDEVANEIMINGFTLHGISVFLFNTDNYYWVNSGRYKQLPELNNIHIANRDDVVRDHNNRINNEIYNMKSYIKNTQDKIIQLESEKL